MFKIATAAAAILVFLAFPSVPILASQAKTIKVLENIYTMIEAQREFGVYGKYPLN